LLSLEGKQKIMRNFKTLGLALVAALALGVTAAASASAEPFYLTAEAASADLVGEQFNTATTTIDIGTVKCGVIRYEGTLPARAAREITITPTYKECQLAGLPIEVDTNSCGYRFTMASKEGSSYEGEAAVLCEEAGDSITFISKLGSTTKCIVHVGAQEGLKSVTYEKSGSPSEIRANLAITGIAYSQTSGTGVGTCPTADNTTNGAYKGIEAIKGYEKETQVSLGLEAAALFASITMLPLEVDYQKKGAGTKRDVTVENVTGGEVKKLQTEVPKGMKEMDLCKGKDLPNKGDKCKEEVECEKAGTTGWITMVTAFGGPLAMASSKIKDC
jgi:hypothetical protein